MKGAKMTRDDSRLSRRAFLAAAGAPALIRCAAARRPNILIAISDDQSYPHTGAMGDKVVKTPGFDRVAAQGVLFRHCYSLSPGCAPARAGLLTGRYPWQLEEAGTHASLFPRKFTVFPDLLEQHGYFVGLTGKGAGPCNYADAGWPRNPAGPSFDKYKLAKPLPGINSNDYARNFEDFLNARPKDKPFCFWYGGTEPHRSYEKGSGAKSGKRLKDVVVPPFLPDTPEVRSDILDYYREIEYFDSHLARMLELLAKRGEMVGQTLLSLLRSGKSGLIEPPRRRVFSGRERHSHARFDNLGYPARAVREGNYLYVWNMKPERWPAGDPELYADIDNGPSKQWMMEHRNDPKVAPLFEHSFGKRPEQQLFDVRKDPGCLRNLAGQAAYESVRKSMRAALEKALKDHGDPRLLDKGDIWESYPRFSEMRPQLGGFAERGKVNPKYLK